MICPIDITTLGKASLLKRALGYLVAEVKYIIMKDIVEQITSS